jgi:hypothetical protein
MLTGEIRNQIDRIWDASWMGGISNPLEVIEQITYLLFLKRLDELEKAEELKASHEKKPRRKRFSFLAGSRRGPRAAGRTQANSMKRTSPNSVVGASREYSVRNRSRSC